MLMKTTTVNPRMILVTEGKIQITHDIIGGGMELVIVHVWM